MREILTNELCVSFNFESIQKDFDIYSVGTTEKHIPGGAYVLDKPLVELKARSLVYEWGGKSFYVLFRKDSIIENDLIRSLRSDDEGDTLKVEKVSPSRLPSDKLLQLLLSEIGNPKTDKSSFNNLTGKLIFYRNGWIDEGRDGFIWGMKGLEIKVDKNMRIDAMACSLTSVALRSKMEFGKTKFHQYPQYCFSEYRNGLRRVTKEEKNRNTNFIIKPVKRKRAHIAYLNFENSEKFDETKIGVLYKVFSILKEEYSDYLSIELKKHRTSEYMNIKRKEMEKSKDIVAKRISSKGLALVDYIKDSTSGLYLEKLKAKIEGEVPGLEVSIEERVSERKFNIKLIHNREYYREDDFDPYNEMHKEAVIQHITQEDFKSETDAAIENTMKELVIKDDLKLGNITLDEWKDRNYEDSWVFGLRDQKNKGHYFMKIHPDGKYEISKLEKSPFNMAEYNMYIEYLGDDKDGKGDCQLVGLIKDSKGNINLIKDTNIRAMPEILELGRVIESVSDNMVLSGEYLKELIERIVISKGGSKESLEKLNEYKAQFAVDEDYNREQIIKIVKSKGAKGILSKAIFEEKGKTLNIYPKNKENREKLFPGILDINYIELGPGKAIYNVGAVGDGMRSNFKCASVMRQIEAVNGGDLFFKELLSLMSVDFVRHKMPTVIPFPFKYLREYIQLQGKGEV